MTVILKPCPWCGGEPYLDCAPLSNGSHGYRVCFIYRIKCAACGATAPKGDFDDIYQTSYEAKQQAIEAWNRRIVLNNYRIDI